MTSFDTQTNELKTEFPYPNKQGMNVIVGIIQYNQVTDNVPHKGLWVTKIPGGPNGPQTLINPN